MSGVTYKQGSLINADEPLIIHGCNAQGSMGKGVARDIRDAWPMVYDAYRAAHRATGLTLGDVIYAASPTHIIGNAITQNKYDSFRKYGIPDLDYDALLACMRNVDTFMIDNKIDAVAMPKIGAGLAGGDWDKIERIISSNISNNVVIYCI